MSHSFLLAKSTCHAVADVGFILDSSGSLRDEYNKEKQFVKALASKFIIRGKGVRGSVVTFSSNAQLSIKFNDHDKTSTFNKAIDNIPLMGFETKIDRALRLTQSQMFTQNNGARAGVPKILILLTDTLQTEQRGAEDPTLVAEELRQSGIHLVVIGIGKGIKSSELSVIAGDSDHVFTAESFDELITNEFVNNISSTACKPGKFLLY